MQKHILSIYVIHDSDLYYDTTIKNSTFSNKTQTHVLPLHCIFIPKFEVIIATSIAYASVRLLQ